MLWPAIGIPFIVGLPLEMKKKVCPEIKINDNHVLNVFVFLPEIQLNVLNDRTQGGSSLSEGEVELMVHRRLTHNGNGGDFPIDEAGVNGKGLIVRGRHYIFIGPTTKSIGSSRKLAESLYMSPVVVFDKYSTIKDYSSQRDITFSPLSESLPERRSFVDIRELETKSSIASFGAHVRVVRQQSALQTG